jgi:hypothetical protein
MTQATMHVKERSEAIQRAQRALKALGEHPHSSKKDLGHAREHLNACYSHASGEHVWNAVAQVEAMAERRYGVPSTEEQRQVAEAREDIEEPATAARGRAAEDRAIPSTSSTTTDVELAPTTSR